MKTLLTVLNYLFFGNIFIAICAVMLCVHTSLCFELKPHPIFLIFIFFSTISSYDIHSIFHSLPVSDSKRMDWVRSRRKTLIYSFVIASTGVLITVWWLIELWYWVVPIAILTLFYSLPRIFPHSGRLFNFIQLYKAFYLAFIWTIVTVILPVYQEVVDFNVQFLVFFISRYLYILQICLLFDYRDKILIEPENRISVLKHMNDKNFSVLCIWVMIGVILTSGTLLYLNLNLKSYLSMTIAEIAFILLFRKSKNSHSDYWYNIVVDGLLLIPGVIVFFWE
jgi:hypothetical protein